MGFQKAKREQVWLKVLLSGASGSGKSYSALKMATGIANKCDSDIAFITAFYSNGIVGSTIKWIERGSMMSRLPENITANGVGLSKSQYNRDIVKRIGDSFDATIYDMIECCL